MKTPNLVLAVSLVLLGCTTQTEPAKVTDDDIKADAKTDTAAPSDSKATTPGPTPRKPRGKQIPAPEDVANPPADATKTASGIVYQTLTPGEGDTPTENDSVKIQVTAWTADGITIETTDGRKTPKLVRMNRPPVPGLGEALALMKVGEKSRFWIPPELTYKGRKGAPEGVLYYEITLEELLKAPPVPEDVGAPPPGAKKTKSGLAYQVLTEGSGGAKPDPWDRVEVHYTGWQTDGKMFDSSITRGRPSTFPVNRVVPGWTEGLQLMTVGQKNRLWIPEKLAYDGAPGKPSGMLVFDVELMKIDELPEPPPPPKVPKNVAAPPAKAKKTESGLAYMVLKPGTGTEKPTETTVVEVHYSGWTTDGKMFDSSVTRGKPTSFPLNRVIKGWTEGLQLMVVGEKTRFWIPEALAYQGKPGKPAGMLVFDVELLSLKK